MAKVRKRKLPSGLVRWQASYVDGAGKRRANSAVFRAMMKFESDNLIEKGHRDFLATFALEVEQYFREAAREIPAAD
jgi:hypothetical protein